MNHMSACFVSSKRHVVRAALAAAMLASSVPSAFAQLDPLINLKDAIWNWSTSGRMEVIIAIDSSERMQRDADNTYYDPVLYDPAFSGHPLKADLGVPDVGPLYRRKVIGELDHALPNT